MPKVFFLPSSNQRTMNAVREAAKASPLLLVLPKQQHVDQTPPEPPPMAA